MDSNELTAEKIFQHVLEEVMRDGDISELERSTIHEVKEALGIDSDAHQRAYRAAVQALRERGRQSGYEMVPEDVFRRVAARAVADGRISEEERKLLDKVAAALQVDPEQNQQIWKAVEETARRQGS